MGEKYRDSSSYLWSYSHISTILRWPRHLTYQVWNINDNLAIDIHQQKYIKGYMGKLYSQSKNWEEDNVVVLDIYGDIAIFYYLWWPRHWKIVTGNKNEHISINIHP